MTVTDILGKLGCHYPITPSMATSRCYKNNTLALENLINAECRRHFNYTSGRAKEEMVVLYTTSLNEKIGYLLSGEHVDNPAFSKTYHEVYEFSPRIVSSDGTMLRALSYEDIWDFYYQISETDVGLVPIVATLFFYLGRLLSRAYTEQECECKVSARRPNQPPKQESASINWEKFSVDTAALSALNAMIGEVSISEDTAISFEAFLYYWDLQFLKDDYLALRLERAHVPRRIAISDMAILYADYYLGGISTGQLLRRISSGASSVNATPEEIELSTATAIEVSDRVRDLHDFMSKEGIAFKRGVQVKFDGEKYRAIFQIPKGKVYIFRWLDEGLKKTCRSAGWHAFSAFQLDDDDCYEQIIEMIR